MSSYIIHIRERRTIQNYSLVNATIDGQLSYCLYLLNNSPSEVYDTLVNRFYFSFSEEPFQKFQKFMFKPVVDYFL